MGSHADGGRRHFMVVDEKWGYLACESGADTFV